MTSVHRILARMRGEGDDADGFTLVEMLTVMVLGTVIGVAVTSAMISAMRSETRVNAHQTSLEQTRVALQRVTREIRNIAPSSSLLQAYQNDLIFNEERSGGYRQVELKTTTTGTRTDLVMLTTDYTGASCSYQNTKPTVCTAGVPRTATILPSITNGSSSTDPLFTFTGRAGYTVPTVPAGQTIDPTTCIWSGQTPVQAAVDCPGEVTVHLMQLIQGAPANRPTDLRDTVQLRNQGT